MNKSTDHEMRYYPRERKAVNAVPRSLDCRKHYVKFPSPPPAMLQ
ncbi:MAG TPA: hypothetical protein VN642_06555 [Dongiaceae bacterium]|nr:hypothetical protein [Dongiaceae bacterium]